jgi:hypothetical protein
MDLVALSVLLSTLVFLYILFRQTATNNQRLLDTSNLIREWVNKEKTSNRKKSKPKKQKPSNPNFKLPRDYAKITIRSRDDRASAPTLLDQRFRYQL